MSKNNIDFVIGGKDSAKPAMSAVEQSLGRLEKKADSVARSTSRLAAVSGVLAGAYASVKTAIAALSGLNAINAAYDTQTAAVKSLTSALSVRGAAAAAESQALQKVAADLQKLTGVGDETTIALMKTATSMGFATDRIDDAAKAAIGLADITGNTLEGSLGDLKAALEGNFEAFYGLNPQIRFMRSNQERLSAVMAIANQGLKQQSQNINTVEGSGKRATGAFGDLMESIGAILAPIRVLINAGIQTLSESLNSVLGPAVQWATNLLENIGPVMDWVKEKVIQGVNLMIGAFTFLETVLLNLGDVWEMVKAYAEKTMLAVAGIVMHTLTVLIPEYAKWFGENFVNLIRDAFNAVFTVITNAGRIIGEMVYQIFAFIASGGKGGISGLMENLGHAASISLMDGFKSSLTSLPAIAERQLSQREKDLADKIGAIGGRLGKEFADKMQERLIGVGGSLADELKAASQIDLKARQAVMTQSVQVTEGRLLTRGPGSTLPNKLDEIIRLIKNPPEKRGPILVQLDKPQMKVWDDIRDNTKDGMVMEAIV